MNDNKILENSYVIKVILFPIKKIMLMLNELYKNMAFIYNQSFKQCSTPND